VEDCGQRIKHLSESLLSFARPTDGIGPVDIPASLDATLRVLGWQMPAGIEVLRDYQCHEKVLGNSASLNEVWVNLVDNALRAMGESGRLSIQTRRVDNDLLVSISDTGSGIPAEKLGQIFEPFFSTRAAGEGTGLGLALCRRAVLRHGGRITAHSELGIGSRFEVLLPLHGSESKVVPIDAARNPPDESSSSENVLVKLDSAQAD
jgi:signal transduction histidine kinase